MPRAKTLSKRLESVRFRALFVVLVMLLNVSFTTLSSVSAYAQTAEEPAVTEVVEEESEETDNEETESEASEEVETSPEEETEETVVVEELPVSNDEQVEEVVVAPLEVTAIIDDPTDLTAEFDCWTRVGLTDYTFTVSYTTSADETWADGSMFNSADPSTQDALLPTMFPSAVTEVSVTGWDGTPFNWTLGDSVVEVSLDGDVCDSPTVGDIVVENAETATLESVVVALSDSNTVCEKVAASLFEPGAGPYTIFAPTNTALASLVASPGTSANELIQLVNNPDELCALIASHVVLGEIVSTDATEAGVTVPAFTNDVDGIFIQLVGDTVYVDGAAVVEADLFGSNGVVHVVDSVLLPQSVGTINDVVTDKTSPALSGMINTASLAGEDMPPGFCVVVRIDGIPYIADVDGYTWSIEEGVVSLNPTKSNTLFDVVVRSQFYQYVNDSLVDMEPIFSCDRIADEMQPTRPGAATQIVNVVTHGGALFGLTMDNTVLSFLEPEVEEEQGEVLGETTTVVEETPVAVTVAPAACGKGVCDGSIAQADPSTIDTDGDGVVDSEDPDPNDPNVTGLEDADEDGDNDETANEDGEGDNEDGDTNVLLWFLAGGGVVAVWYLLWQRSGREA